MDKVIEEAKKLRSALEEREEFKEYFRLKRLYEENEEIKSILIQISKVTPNSKEHQALIEQYNSYPLVNNYLRAEEEVQAILRTVKDIIKL